MSPTDVTRDGEGRAVLVTCEACRLFRIADNYSAAHALGQDHRKISGHEALQYLPVDAPDRIRLTQHRSTARHN